MRQVITGGQQQIKSYGICSTIGHATDMCPTLYEETNHQVNTGMCSQDQPNEIMTHAQIPIIRAGETILILVTGTTT